MGKTPITKSLYLALILILTSGIFISTTVAFQDWPDPPSSPNNTPPSINMLTPSKNQIVNSNNISIVFTVIKPQSWISGLEMTFITPGYLCWGKITSISYILDGIQSNKTSANDPIVLGLRVYNEPPSRTLDASINLTGLSDGPHSLMVSAEGESLYFTGQFGSWPSTIVIGNSSEINFIVDTGPPTVTLISPKTNVYNTTEIPLIFIVNEPSQIKYSLDALDNVTIVDNSTLSGLAYGKHNITVYALDTAGRIGTSETLTFTIFNPKSFPIVLFTASIATVTIVGIGILVYFKKHHKRITN